MERLTERLPNGVIRVDFTKQKESVMSRLAAIEDILGDEYDLDRLRKLVHADREDTNCTPAELSEEIGQKLISKR